MNEGDPTFGSGTYTVSVQEDTAANSEVVLLDVTDADDGSDGKTVLRVQLKIILVVIGETYDGVARTFSRRPIDVSAYAR